MIEVNTDGMTSKESFSVENVGSSCSDDEADDDNSNFIKSEESLAQREHSNYT